MSGDAITRAEADALFASARAATEQRAREMPTTEDALHALYRAYWRLREIGWRDAAYGPQDGTTVEVVEAGCSAVHVARTYMMQSAFPRLTYWIDEAGDSWPSSPILFRVQP